MRVPQEVGIPRLRTGNPRCEPRWKLLELGSRGTDPRSPVWSSSLLFRGRGGCGCIRAPGWKKWTNCARRTRSPGLRMKYSRGSAGPVRCSPVQIGRDARLCRRRRYAFQKGSQGGSCLWGQQLSPRRSTRISFPMTGRRPFSTGTRSRAIHWGAPPPWPLSIFPWIPPRRNPGPGSKAGTGRD